MWSRVHLPVCEHMEAEVEAMCFPLHFSILIVLRRCLSLNQFARPASQWALGISQHWGYKSVLPHLAFNLDAGGSELRTRCLCSKHFAHQVIPLAPKGASCQGTAEMSLHKWMARQPSWWCRNSTVGITRNANDPWKLPTRTKVRHVPRAHSLQCFSSRESPIPLHAGKVIGKAGIKSDFAEFKCKMIQFAGNRQWLRFLPANEMWSFSYRKIKEVNPFYSQEHGSRKLNLLQ